MGAELKPCTLPGERRLRSTRYWPSDQPVFDEDDIETLGEFRAELNRITEVEKRRQHGRALLRDLWPDPATFIAKQHLIGTKKPGVTTLLQWNYVQRGFYKIVEQQRAAGKPVRIITLKARQLGQSTGIQSWHYEECDRKPNRVAFTICHNQPSTVEMFDKARKIHRNLWFPQRSPISSGAKMELENHSTFLTATAGNLEAGRSLTIHNLHISELPMWPNADEVLDGLLNSVSDDPDTSIFVESTAKGTANAFHEMWIQAEEGHSDFYPYFAPWFWNPQYRVAIPKGKRDEVWRTLTAEEERHMRAYDLTLEQILWRRRTIKTKCKGSERKFKQEYPACATEAFLSSGRPVFNQQAIRDLEENPRDPQWRGHVWLEAV